MSNVIDLNPTYPHTVPTMIITFTKTTEDGPLYEPVPDAAWTPTQNLSWLAGVVAAELRMAVQIRRSRAMPLTVETFSLQVGDRAPITGLTITRVLDILGGCMTAVGLLKDAT